MSVGPRARLAAGLLALSSTLLGCGVLSSSTIGTDPTPGKVEGVEEVVPAPGQLDVHPIPIDRFAIQIEDRHMTLSAFYTSGPEPCFVLDSIGVVGGQGAIAITLFEGHAPGDVACRMPAIRKKTFVDLGVLPLGPIRMTDSGHAPVVDMVVQ